MVSVGDVNVMVGEPRLNRLLCFLALHPEMECFPARSLTTSAEPDPLSGNSCPTNLTWPGFRRSAVIRRP